MDTRKRVIIEGDASGIDNAFAQASKSGNSFYERLKTNAQEYTDNLKVQANYIEKMISLEQKRIEQYNKDAQNQLRTEKESELAKAQGQTREAKSKREMIEREYAGYGGQYTADYLASKQNLAEAQQMFNMEYEMTRGRSARDFETEESRRRRRRFKEPFRKGTFFRRRRYYLSRFGMAFSGGAGIGIGSGLGMGFGLGVMGILYESIRQANEYQKTLVKLNATMNEIDKSSLAAATSLGLTSTQMNQFAIQVAQQSGGVLGYNTGRTTLLAEQIAKAFNVPNNVLFESTATARMGGTNPAVEMVRLLREMLRVGSVTKDNMAQLSEKFGFWQKLNDIQSRQMLNVLPGISPVLLGGMQATGLPILSDQRQLQFIEGLNKAITNSDNEFKKAFVFNALNTGNYITTMARVNEGIFGFNPQNG